MSLRKLNLEHLKALLVTSYTADKCQQVQEYATMIDTGHS